jgi:hypothetical protein
MILQVVSRVGVVIIGMRTEKKYPTSENISKRKRKTSRIMRRKGEKIRRRRIKKRERMKGIR